MLLNVIPSELTHIFFFFLFPDIGRAYQFANELLMSEVNMGTLPPEYAIDRIELYGMYLLISMYAKCILITWIVNYSTIYLNILPWGSVVNDGKNIIMLKNV